MSMEIPSLNVNYDRKTVELSREEKINALRKKLAEGNFEPQEKRSLQQKLVQLEADQESSIPEASV